MTEAGIRAAKAQLSQLVERARAGEEIVLTRRGKRVARLVPVAAEGPMASARGAWRGRVTIAEDFDELPVDIAEAFGA